MNLLPGNRFYPSGIRIVVTVRSLQIVDSDKLPQDFQLHLHAIAILKIIFSVLIKTDGCGL